MLNLLCDATSVLKTVGSVLIAFVILMIMVLIHEAGHYAAGKMLGFQINEFSVGMGPKIFSKKKKNGEVISLRALPLGGFCAFEGEDADVANPKAFNAQKPWKRLIVLVSGALFNFISAILIAVITFCTFGDLMPIVKGVHEYAPQQNQVLQYGDIIYEINGKKVYTIESTDLGKYMSDGEMQFVVLRPDENGKYHKVTLDGLVKGSFYTFEVAKVPQGIQTDIVENGELKTYKLAAGDTISKINGNVLCKDGDFAKFVGQLVGETCLVTATSSGKEVHYEVPVSVLLSDQFSVSQSKYDGIGITRGYVRHKFTFGQSLLRSVPYCFQAGMSVLRTLGGLITGAVGIEAVGGPITTISITSQVVQQGFGSVLYLMVLISVNLAVFNLLPVPALDGCRMIFVLIEWIARKPINRKIEAYINGIGLIVLIALMVLIDILKL